MADSGYAKSQEEESKILNDMHFSVYLFVLFSKYDYRTNIVSHINQRHVAAFT